MAAVWLIIDAYIKMLLKSCDLSHSFIGCINSAVESVRFNCCFFNDVVPLCLVLMCIS